MPFFQAEIDFAVVVIYPTAHVDTKSVRMHFVHTNNHIVSIFRRCDVCKIHNVSSKIGSH